MAMIVLQHLVAAAMLFGVSWMTWRDLRNLQRQADSESKILVYIKRIIALWMLAIAAILLTGFHPIFWYHDVLLPDSPIYGISFASFFLLAGFVAVTLYHYRHPSRESRRWTPFQAKPFFYPATAKEKSWYFALIVTAGVCEGILFRSYLFYYLTYGPWYFSTTTGFVAAGVLFGLYQWHQGIAGMASRVLLALAALFLYAESGNLWYAIGLHVFFELLIFLDPSLEKRNGETI